MMTGKDLGVLVAKIVVLTILLMIISGIGSRFLPAGGAEGEEQIPVAAVEGAPAPPSASFMAIVLGVMLLQVIALAYPIMRSTWNGWKLTLAVFVLFFGTVTFMGQIESLVYLGSKMPNGMLSGIVGMGLFTAAVFSPIAVLVLGRWKAGPLTSAAPGHREPTSTKEWGWKTAVAGLVFLSLYYLFGYFVAWRNPLVREYYGGTDPGSFFAQIGSIIGSTPWMLPLQYVRGLLWVALAVLVIRMMKGSWRQVALAVSILFTVPSFYLLFPNPLMPDAVRMAHLVETAPYQFLFGWFVVLLFCNPGAERLNEQIA
jgi:hypothetical protein